MRLLLALTVIGLLALPATAEDLESRAERIEGKLMAPCCGGTVLSQHYSGSALEMCDEIRAMLAQGRTEQEILDFYVDRHGPLILASPPGKGFGVMAYVLPALLVLVVVVIGGVALRRWRTGPTVEDLPPAISEEDARYVEQIEREVRLG